MNHLSEEQLILHYYGEARDGSGHLQFCAACRAEYAEIARLLDACGELPVPDPGFAFETNTWQKLAPALTKSRTAWWRQTWIFVPAMAALLIGAFFLGRVTTVTPSLARIDPAPNRQRIRLATLGEHLERSQMVLVELANAQPGDARDIHLTEQRARDLVTENRLYRQTAMLSGDRDFSAVLDELERVLTDVANSPARLSSPELRQLQQRIKSGELIFKIRVIDSNLQQKGSAKL